MALQMAKYGRRFRSISEKIVVGWPGVFQTANFNSGTHHNHVEFTLCMFGVVLLHETKQTTPHIVITDEET